jgi:hypothetical protein
MEVPKMGCVCVPPPVCPPIIRPNTPSTKSICNNTSFVERREGRKEMEEAKCQGITQKWGENAEGFKLKADEYCEMETFYCFGWMAQFS